MEHWSEIVLAYGCLGIAWSLYSLFICGKHQRKKDYFSRNKYFFRFIFVFLLIMTISIAHIGYLLGVMSMLWPIFVAIGGVIIMLYSINKNCNK